MKSIQKFEDKKVKNMSNIQGGKKGKTAGYSGKDSWENDSKGKVINLQTHVGIIGRRD